MRIVIALGGNALLRRHEPMTAETQRANVKRAVAALRPLCRFWRPASSSCSHHKA